MQYEFSPMDPPTGPPRTHIVPMAGGFERRFTAGVPSDFQGVCKGHLLSYLFS